MSGWGALILQQLQLLPVIDDCLMMAYSHVAHDCILGNRVILANSVGLAGHAELGDHVIIGGLAGVHQFCRVGESAMCAGNSVLAICFLDFLGRQM